MVSYSFLFNMMIHSSPVWAEKKEYPLIMTIPAGRKQQGARKIIR
jgi:hypothetical protein